MRVIQPNCRVQFTAEDVAFIVSVLAKNGNEPTLVELLTDLETRDSILDDPALHRALLEQRGCLRVSTHFYFYVLVRHVLRDAGIMDRAVADYVAEVLAEFSRDERRHLIARGQSSPMEYFFEMLAALQSADDHTAFFIRAHIGNHSLFLSGVFPERIRYRTERRACPNLRYYEEVGRMNFRAASGHRLAQRYDLTNIFETLSERFDKTRLALNDLAERVFSLGDPDVPLLPMFNKEAP